MASFNSKKNIDLSKFDIELVKTETVQRGTFAKNIDDMLFVKKRRVVGPVVLGKDISVLKVLNINKQGSIKGLNEVYDEIAKGLTSRCLKEIPNETEVLINLHERREGGKATVKSNVANLIYSIPRSEIQIVISH